MSTNEWMNQWINQWIKGYYFANGEANLGVQRYTAGEVAAAQVDSPVCVMTSWRKLTLLTWRKISSRWAILAFSFDNIWSYFPPLTHFIFGGRGVESRHETTCTRKSLLKIIPVKTRCQKAAVVLAKALLSKPVQFLLMYFFQRCSTCLVKLTTEFLF